MKKAADLRKHLVEVALEWESHFGVGPSITSVISETDAALQLLGMSEEEYCTRGKDRTAVSKDFDFVLNEVRYQITANRPGGKKGSRVALVSHKAKTKKPLGWDKLIWMLYDRNYILQEAYEFDVEDYRNHFQHLKRLSPKHMQQDGRCLYPKANH